VHDVSRRVGVAGTSDRSQSLLVVGDGVVYVRDHQAGTDGDFGFMSWSVVGGHPGVLDVCLER
jgi:hypothetical protein